MQNIRYDRIFCTATPTSRMWETNVLGPGTVKDVQGLLRHSRAATTTDVYMQEIPESVPATVNAINAELRVKREEIHADC
jgi:hypothetical protein